MGLTSEPFTPILKLGGGGGPAGCWVCGVGPVGWGVGPANFKLAQPAVVLALLAVGLGQPTLWLAQLLSMKNQNFTRNPFLRF